MRVIAGKARKLQLKTIEGLETRPTTDRIKETLFNIINTQIADSLFLDLFSGSGGIGIEALSRGAEQCYFVEQNKACVECIKSNLEHTRLENNGIVMNCDVLTALHSLEDKEITFDFIFMDPPYNNDLEMQVLKYLSNSNIIDEYTSIIIEASIETCFDNCCNYGFSIMREKKYKTNKHVFITVGQDPDRHTST